MCFQRKKNKQRKKFTKNTHLKYQGSGPAIMSMINDEQAVMKVPFDTGTPIPSTEHTDVNEEKQGGEGGGGGGGEAKSNKSIASKSQQIKSQQSKTNNSSKTNKNNNNNNPLSMKSATSIKSSKTGATNNRSPQSESGKQHAKNNRENDLPLCSINRSKLDSTISTLSQTGGSSIVGGASLGQPNSVGGSAISSITAGGSSTSSSIICDGNSSVISKTGASTLDHKSSVTSSASKIGSTFSAASKSVGHTKFGSDIYSTIPTELSSSNRSEKDNQHAPKTVMKIPESKSISKSGVTQETVSVMMASKNTQKTPTSITTNITTSTKMDPARPFVSPIKHGNGGITISGVPQSSKVIESHQSHRVSSLSAQLRMKSTMKAPNVSNSERKSKSDLSCDATPLVSSGKSHNIAK